MKEICKLKRTWLLLSWPMALLFYILARNSEYIAEVVFARHIYKVYSQVLSFFTGWLPFSLAEFILLIGPIVISFFFFHFLYKIIHNKDNRKVHCIKAVLNIFCFFGMVFFLFMIGCGTNYYRYSFAYYSGLEIRPSSKEELYQLGLSLTEQANEIRAQLLTEDESGAHQLSISNYELGKETRQAYQNLVEEYEVLSGRYPAPKPVFFSEALSKMQITGIFIPFTMEANVNINISDYAIAYTMCHELAHLRGFMREDEANYIAYLACMASNQLELQYSATMHALIFVGNALYEKDTELYAMIRENFSSKVILDFRENSLYWSNYENTVISEVANNINDSYLKANDQEDGVESYGRMVDLLLAAYRKNAD